MSWVAGEDIETQRKGVVLIMWFEPSFPVISTNRMSSMVPFPYQPAEYISFRVVSGHFCVPDTAIYHFLRAFMQLSAGANLWLQLKAHHGRIEMHYF